MKYLIATVSLMALLVIPAVAQDQGIPDTVRVEGDTLRIGQSTPIRVAIANDYDLRAFFLAFIMTSIDGGFAVTDSIVWVNRMANPAVLNYRLWTDWESNGTSPDTIRTEGIVGGTSTPLPPGNDAIYDIYMTGLSPGHMVVDSSYVPPGFYFSLFPYIDNYVRYEPAFIAGSLTVVYGTLPPLVEAPDEDPRLVAGDDVEFEVSAESPEDYPVTIELVDFSHLETGTGTPSNAPEVTGDNPIEFSWETTSSDVDLWSATFSACDSAGVCTEQSVTIQVVSSGDFLLSFAATETSDGPDVIHMTLGNSDSDPEPELLTCAYGYTFPATVALLDFTDEATFETVWTFSPLLSIRSPVAGFLNGDANLDFMVASNTSYCVWPLFGDGDNSLTRDTVSTGYHSLAREAVLGEFTGDQYLDYVAVGLSGLWMLKGQADGAFQPLSPSSIDDTRSLNSADFDGDGLDDLAVGTADGLSVYLSDGTGGFDLHATYSQTYGSVDIEVTNKGSDFNNDDNYDLCLATPSIGGTHSELVVYLGNGDGTFTQNVVRTPLGHIMSNCAGDFNSDGNLDIAYVNGSRDYCAIVFGDGDGNFDDEVRYDIDRYHPERVVCFDFDADGDLDLLVASSTTHIGASLFYFENQLDPENFASMPVQITAEDNAQLALSSPSGQIVNMVRSSIASGMYQRRSINSNSVIDDAITVNAVEMGAYTINVTPKPGVTKAVETFSLELTVGQAPYRFADGASMAPEGYQFDLYPRGGSPISPPSGSYVYQADPTLQWPGSGSFDLQLATDLGFTDVILSGVVSGNQVTVPELDTSVATLYYWRIKPVGQAEYETLYAFNLELVDCIARGNVNHDPMGAIDISDLVYLIDFMFLDGPEPPNFDEANVDGAGTIDISDAVYLVEYMFTDGPAPPPCP